MGRKIRFDLKEKHERGWRLRISDVDEAGKLHEKRHTTFGIKPTLMSKKRFKRDS